MPRSHRWPGVFWIALVLVGAASALTPHFLPLRVFGWSFETAMWIAGVGPVLLAVAGVLAMVHARATAYDRWLAIGWLLVATFVGCFVLAIPVWVADLVWYYILAIFLAPLHIVSLAIFVVGGLAAHRAHRVAEIDSPRAFLPFFAGVGGAVATIVLRVSLLQHLASFEGIVTLGFAPDGTELAQEGPRNLPALTPRDFAMRSTRQSDGQRPLVAAAPGEAALDGVVWGDPTGSDSRRRLELRRLTLDGSEEPGWSRRLESERSGISRLPTAIAVAPTGRVFILGYARDPKQPESWWIEQFDADGNELPDWNLSFSSEAPLNRPNGIACDRDGSVYVFGEIGTTEFGAGGTSAWIRKFDPDGHEVLAGWNKRIRGGPSRPMTAAVAAAIDAHGGLYALLDDGSQSVHRFSVDGEEILEGWPQELPDPRRTVALASDPAGGVFVFGQFEERRGWEHIRDRGWIRRFDPDGHPSPGWEKTFDSPGNSTDVTAAAFDSSGDVCFGGTEKPAEPQVTRWWIRKFHSDGSPVAGWDKRLGEEGGNQLYALVTGRNGELYAIGEGHGFTFTRSFVQRWWGY